VIVSRHCASIATVTYSAPANRGAGFVGRRPGGISASHFLISSYSCAGVSVSEDMCDRSFGQVGQSGEVGWGSSIRRGCPSEMNCTATVTAGVVPLFWSMWTSVPPASTNELPAA
jgi:hypothetical protein